jgi:hypothetical protein
MEERILTEEEQKKVDYFKEIKTKAVNSARVLAEQVYKEADFFRSKDGTLNPITYLDVLIKICLHNFPGNEDIAAMVAATSFFIGASVNQREELKLNPHKLKRRVIRESKRIKKNKKNR